ncbi:MAG: hypothetical protein Q9162_001338 [Coniocarpon cinnabarinum]
MNSPTAHARMGDFGIRSPAQFDELNRSTRLSPTVFGSSTEDLNVDIDIYYLMRLKTDSAVSHEWPLIGGVSLAQRKSDLPPDAGWAVLESHHGHGYAAEAARGLLRYARHDLGIMEIMAWPGTQNEPSVRTAQKAGFQFGGHMASGDDKPQLVYILPGMDFEKIRGKTISLFGEQETGQR